jgi:hypothetical protein
MTRLQQSCLRTVQEKAPDIRSMKCTAKNMAGEQVGLVSVDLKVAPAPKGELAREVPVQEFESFSKPMKKSLFFSVMLLHLWSHQMS